MSFLLRVLFVAYVAATALHVGWILAHEPFVFDAWNVAIATESKPFSAGNLFDFWWHEYTHSNPRIGQPLTYLAYKLEDFAVVASPLAHLAIALAAFVLGTGRWPAWSRGRDLALVAIAIGTTWFALPELGKTLFNRAYGANYAYGAAIQLWFLVPLRVAREGRAAPLWCLAYLLAGVIAGMANEHTGPTLCAFVVGYAWWIKRRTGERPILAWAGALGVIAGFAAIFFAPGQGERYDGLANRMTLAGRLLHRGVSGNLEILSGLVAAAAPLLALIVIVLVVSRRARGDDAESQRTPLALVGLALAASVAITMTLFVSPKLGSRFFLFPMGLLLAGFMALADAALVTRVRLMPFVVLAVAASVYAGVRTVPLYTRVARASDARLAALAAAPAGGVFTAESFEQVSDSWWFLGDDLRDVRKRELVARYFGLGGVVFRAYDVDAPLGITDVRLAARCRPATAPCLESDAWFERGGYRGIDLPALHRQLGVAVDRLRAEPGGDTLEQLDVEVGFAGARPQLPRERLLLARWTRDGLAAHAGAVRTTRSKAREVVVPPSLAGTGRDVYLYEVGGAVTRLGTTDAPLKTYVPAKNGVNWALACDATECVVFAVLKIGR